MYCHAGFTAKGEVNLLGAHIGEQLTFAGAALTNPDGPALMADALTVEQGVYCGQGFSAAGEVRLPGAHINGQLDLSGAEIEGQVVLAGAEITTDLVLAGATLTNPDGCALMADRLTVGQGMFCSQGFTVKGEVSLSGAHISGQLDLTTATLANPDGPALAASRLTVDQDLHCSHGFTAQGELQLHGAHVGGQLNLSGARIEGQLVLAAAHVTAELLADGAALTNPDGPALIADGLTVDRGMSCREEFSARGELRLAGAHIGGPVDFTGATLTNPDGPALTAHGLRGGQGMLCREAFTARGGVGLADAHIDGTLSFMGATLINADGVALDLVGVRTNTLVLRLQAPPKGAVVLTDAQVDSCEDTETTWPEVLSLHGFTYGTLIASPEVDIKTRLRWLALDPGGYTPQLYEQLGAFYRRVGREDDAQKVAIAKQRRRRQSLKLPGRAWNSLLRWTIGYGYRTWQAGLWLLGLLLIGWLVFARAYPAHMTPTTPSGEPSPDFQPLVYTLDTLLPIIDLNQQGKWIPHGLAQWWAWVSILAGWVLTGAVIASLSGLVKKE